MNARRQLFLVTLFLVVVFAISAAGFVVITRKDGASLFQPDPEVVLGEGDRLLVIGRAGTAARLDQLAGVD